METKEHALQNFLYLLKEVWLDQKNLFFFYVANIILMLVYSATGILAPRFMIAELTGSGRIGEIVKIVLIFFVLTAVSGFLASYIKQYYMIGITYVRYHFLQRMKEKTMRVQYKSLEDPKYLNNFWRVKSAVSDIEFGVYGVLVQLFILSANAVTSLFYLGILSTLNWWVVLLLVGNIYLVYLFRSKASKYAVNESKKAVPYNRRQWYLSRTMEDFAYGKDIRIYGLSNFILKKLKDNHAPKQAVEVSIQKHHYVADVAESILSCVRDAVIYGYMIVCVLNGRISIADFTMCFMAVANLTIMLESVFEDVAFIKNDMVRIEEMRTYLELPNEGSGETTTVQAPAARQYELKFEHVSFRYPGADSNVYTDFNFTIKAGEKLAIVGINGAGKTTLVKLLTRLYTPTEGRILLNGVDINQLALADYRKLLTAVFQDINLFAMSLKENITCSDGPVDEEKFHYAIENAGLSSFYTQHGENPDMPLTRYLYDDGVDVSGGERQKIGIARALYKDGRIMIFDEPTAALDAHAEYMLYHELAEMSKDKTLVFISHRLASTRFCDKIALIDGGRVAEFGTHEELIEKQGMYYKMFQAQKKYYEESPPPVGGGKYEESPPPMGGGKYEESPPPSDCGRCEEGGENNEE